MSKTNTSEINPKSWRVDDGRIVELLLPLFNYVSVPMVNIQTLQRSDRLVWTFEGNKLLSLYSSAKYGGSVMTDKEEFERVNVSKSPENPKGIQKERKRIEVDGCALCALKLSAIRYGMNSMALPISPSELRKLIDDNYRTGNYHGTEASAKFTMIRSNDLRREMAPQKDDKWIVLKTAESSAIKSIVAPINILERHLNSPWRLANEDPKTIQLLEEITRQGEI